MRRGPGRADRSLRRRHHRQHYRWPLAGVDVKLTYIVKDRDTGGSTN